MLHATFSDEDEIDLLAHHIDDIRPMCFQNVQANFMHELERGFLLLCLYASENRADTQFQ